LHRLARALEDVVPKDSTGFTFTDLVMLADVPYGSLDES
jgi:hypothetical protein